MGFNEDLAVAKRGANDSPVKVLLRPEELNQLVSNAISELEKQETDIQELRQMDIIDWIESNIKIFDAFQGKVVPFSFDGREYLIDLYYSLSKPGCRDVVMKGRQVEISTMGMNIAHYFIDTHSGYTFFHCFPTARKCGEFSDQKLKDFHTYNEKFKKRIEKDYVDNKSIKQYRSPGGTMGRYMLLSAGSESQTNPGEKLHLSSAKSLSGDYAWFDEGEGFRPGDYKPIMSATSHSPWQCAPDVSTPLLPASHFDMKHKKGTQNVFEFKCKCGFYQELKMDNIVKKNNAFNYHCTKCGEILDRKLRRMKIDGKWVVDQEMGRWRSKNPEGLYPSWHISQLMVPWISATKIKLDEQDPSIPKRDFFNEDLGIPYSGDERIIHLRLLRGEGDTNLEKNLGFLYDPTDALKTDIAIDWGKETRILYGSLLKNGKVLVHNYHVIADNDEKRHVDFIDKLLINKPTYTCVADMGYELGRLNQLWRRFGARVWGVIQASTASQPRRIYNNYKEGENIRQNVIQVNHSSIVERVARFIESGGVHFTYSPEVFEDVDKVFENMCLVDKTEIIRRTDGQAVNKLNYDIGRAHWFACLIYLLLDLKFKHFSQDKDIYGETSESGKSWKGMKIFKLR